jgi:hypothetical protein
VHEFFASFLIFAEGAQHCAAGEYGILLLNAPHHHTKMPGLDHNADALRIQAHHQDVGDFFCKSFLYLESPGVYVDNPGNFAQADNLAVWHVCDMALAIERQKMVFAQAVKVDILDNNHLVVLFCKERTVDNLTRVFWPNPPDPGPLLYVL